MKKILYLVTEDWYFCSHRLRLAEAAKNEGYEIFVVTNAGDSAHKIVTKGFTLLPLSMHRSLGSPLRELGTLIRLVLLYKQIKPDLVHHISLKPVILGSLAAWITGIPRIVNSYTGLGYLFISDTVLARLFLSLIVPVMSLIMKNKRYYSIVQNSDDVKALLNLGMINIEQYSLIRGSGVDTTIFGYSPVPIADYQLVLFASRLLKDKGVIEFIEAVKILIIDGIPARFIIVGDTDPGNPTSINPDELDTWIKQGIIEWWGYREDMSQVFKKVHIVCLPSYREGLPKVLLEAASCGRPIVTTDVPGCRDVVQDGINGFLVPAYDSTGLAQAISRLLTSAELLNQMGIAGRKRVIDNFGIEMINSATIDVYNKLLLSSQ